MADSSEIGPITYGATPSDVYSNYETRQKELRESMPLFEESLQVVPKTKVDSTFSTPSQLDLYFSVKVEPKDTDIGPPQKFSTIALFTRESLMRSFGPPAQQEVALDKLNELSVGAKTPQEEGQVEHITQFIETVQQLNLINQSIFQEQDRIGKA
jgi:hypothetical protein